MSINVIYLPEKMKLMARKLEVLFGGKQLQDTGTTTKKNIHYYAES